MRLVNTLIICLLPVALTGCLKPLNVKPEPKNFAPKMPSTVNVPKKDNGAIYQDGMRVGLFEDSTARYVGDLVMINLAENINASATANTNSSKDNKVDLPTPTLAGQPVKKEGVEILNNSFTGEREFNGQGTSAKSSTFNGKVAATVIKVFPNGNLLVQGEKMMLLNESDEYVRFVGIIRPQDIAPDNTIASSRVGNIHVAYSGQGDISAANKMGPLGRFFTSQAWPY